MVVVSVWFFGLLTIPICGLDGGARGAFFFTAGAGLGVGVTTGVGVGAGVGAGVTTVTVGGGDDGGDDGGVEGGGLTATVALAEALTSGPVGGCPVATATFVNALVTPAWLQP